LLLMVTFVPFPTAVLAQYLGQPGARAAAVFYIGTFVITAIAFNVLWKTAVRRRLLKGSVSETHVAKIHNAYRFGLTAYVVSTLVAFGGAPLGRGICLSLGFYGIVFDYGGGGRGSCPPADRSMRKSFGEPGRCGGHRRRLVAEEELLGFHRASIELR